MKKMHYSHVNVQREASFHPIVLLLICVDGQICCGPENLGAVKNVPRESGLLLDIHSNVEHFLLNKIVKSSQTFFFINY